MAKLTAQALEMFVAHGAKIYESNSMWKETAVMFPVITIDGDGATILKDRYGWQIRLAFEDAAGKIHYSHAEVPKEYHAKAANGYPSWKIANYICTQEYKAVALNNGTVISLDEYNKNKDALASVGVVVQTHTDENTERADKGFIHIPAFDPAKKVDDQKSSLKFVATPI